MTLKNPKALFDAIRSIAGPLDQADVDLINRALIAAGGSAAPVKHRGGIEAMIEATIGKEGAYSDHPADRGGKTMWGITEYVARRNGYKGAMRDLPRDKAVAIYRQEYAIKPGFAAVAEISPSVGEELFDTGVNMGPAVPSIWLQEWLNAFNNQGKLYPDIKEDGDIGPGTLAALRSFKAKRGADAEAVLVRALNCSQGERYKTLSRNRRANEAFTWGWLRTRVEI